MDVLKVVGGCFVAAALVLCGIAQFTPWAGVHQGVAGFSFEVDAYVWEAKTEFRAAGEGGSDSTGWHNDDFDDANGIGRVRATGPLTAVALGLLLLGTVLQLAVRRPFGALVTLAAFAVGTVALVLMSTGASDLFEDAGDDVVWLAAFWLSLTGLVLALAGAILGLLPARLAPKVTSTGGPSY